MDYPRQIRVPAPRYLLMMNDRDGLDIDWEYPKDATEAEHLVLLLRETRLALDHAASKYPAYPSYLSDFTTPYSYAGRMPHFLLTIACPAGPSNCHWLRLAEMDRYLDFWNMMCYDYVGSWDSRAGHQANLHPSRDNPASTPFSTNAAVDYYLNHGVKSEKIVLGMPMYGRAFENTEGPGKGFQGTGEGSWENGVWDYKALPRAGAKVEEDLNGIGASWSFDRKKGTMVTYDTVGMVERKADAVREWRLGGGMWWESSGDKKFGEGSLLEAFVKKSGGVERLDGTENELRYPESKYTNLRNGFPDECGVSGE